MDSGADVCLLKESALQYLPDINEDEICVLNGISAEQIETLGSFFLELYFENWTIKQKFHLVSKDFPIPHQGILGINFLRNNDVSLKYGFKDELEFTNFSIPIHNGPINNSIVIPPRCEVFKKITLPTDSDYIVNDEDIINPYIFMSKNILNHESPFIRILNTSTETITIKTNSIHLLTL